MTVRARYYIYRNLNKGGFSIKYKGLVTDVLNTFEAFNVEFSVSRAGRERVLKNKVKNVHAYVVAESWTPKLRPVPKGMKEVEVTYNPYKHESFVIKETGEPVHEAAAVRFHDNRCFILQKEARMKGILGVLKKLKFNPF